MKRILLFAFALFTTLNFANAQALTDSLLFYYDFNDGNAIDQSGNGYHGIVNGPVSGMDNWGYATQAFMFDGVDDYVSVANVAALEKGYPVSFSAWVNLTNLPASGKEAPIIGNDQENFDYNGYWMSVNDAGNVLLCVGGGLGFRTDANRKYKVSSATISTGTWHHVVGVIRGAADMDIYIDCSDAGGTYAGTGGTAATYSSYGGKVGQSEALTAIMDYYQWEGGIDEVAMWNRGLSSTEVSQLCTGALQAFGKKNTEVKLYPNPSIDQTILEFDNPLNLDHELQILNEMGQLVRRTATSSNKVIIEKNDLASGLYFYRLSTGNDLVATGKIVFE